MSKITYFDIDTIVSKLKDENPMFNNCIQTTIKELSKEFPIEDVDSKYLSNRIRMFYKKRQSLRKVWSTERESI